MCSWYYLHIFLNKMAQLAHQWFSSVSLCQTYVSCTTTIQFPAEAVTVVIPTLTSFLTQWIFSLNTLLTVSPLHSKEMPCKSRLCQPLLLPFSRILYIGPGDYTRSFETDNWLVKAARRNELQPRSFFTCYKYERNSSSNQKTLY